MLEQVRGARTVRSPIESLDLGDETFDVVMPASFLVHAGEHRVREAFEGYLEAAGPRVDRCLTDDGIWVRAVPFQGPSGGQWTVLKLRQGLASGAFTSESVVAR